MSDLTDALSKSLLLDLDGHLDPYQLRKCWSEAELWPDATPQQAAAWFLAHSLFKKYNDRSEPSKADVLAPMSMKNAAKCDTSCELQNQ